MRRIVIISTNGIPVHLAAKTKTTFSLYSFIKLTAKIMTSNWLGPWVHTQVRWFCHDGVKIIQRRLTSATLTWVFIIGVTLSNVS